MDLLECPTERGFAMHTSIASFFVTMSILTASAASASVESDSTEQKTAERDQPRWPPRILFNSDCGREVFYEFNVP